MSGDRIQTTQSTEQYGNEYVMCIQEECSWVKVSNFCPLIASLCLHSTAMEIPLLSFMHISPY